MRTIFGISIGDGSTNPNSSTRALHKQTTRVGGVRPYPPKALLPAPRPRPGPPSSKSLTGPSGNPVCSRKTAKSLKRFGKSWQQWRCGVWSPSGVLKLGGLKEERVPLKCAKWPIFSKTKPPTAKSCSWQSVQIGPNYRSANLPTRGSNRWGENGQNGALKPSQTGRKMAFFVSDD